MALWVRENDLALADQHAQAMVVLMHEGWTASCHFVYQDAEGPPVDGESMTLHIEDFRSEVLSCSAERLRGLIGLQEFR